AKELCKEVLSQSILEWNYRNISSIPSILLEEGGHVQHLYLKRNSITHIPKNIGNMKNLTYLYIPGNKIKILPSSIGELRSLQVLDISANKIEYLPSALCKLSSLRSLIATYNKIKTFPQDLCKLRSLCVLMLSGNELLYLPEDMRGLSGLQGLDVDYNSLQELPHSLCQLPLLQRISCCVNNLLHLPAKHFKTTSPRIYFDGNPHLNYLPFALLERLRTGETWEPAVLQTSGSCLNGDDGKEKLTLMLKQPKLLHEEFNNLVLPSELCKMNCTNMQSVPTPLTEIVLRYIWNQASNGDFNSANNKVFIEVLPNNLKHELELGPVAECCSPYCAEPIFSFAFILVISVNIASRPNTTVSRPVPVMMHYCSERCAAEHKTKITHLRDEYSVWLTKKINNKYILEYI
ncbi:unnamed protein product, partial [Meganyctiphanes norvegica]